VESSYPIAAHAVRTANLRALLKYVEGALKIEAFKSADEKEPIKALSGDFIRVGPDGLAGSALVEKPAGLCKTWDVRFKPGTSFLFYLQGSGSPTGTAYDEAGHSLGDVTIPSPPLPLESFLVPASTITVNGSPLTGNGSIEWDLGVKGHVAMLFPGDGNEPVLIPGVCLEEEDSPED
jgi:hypothetical protein